MYRMYYETKKSLVNIWVNNPAVASVLFGLPIGFLLLICYSTCCTDIMDASDDDEDGMSKNYLPFKIIITPIV